MSLVEIAALSRILEADPSSHVGAVMHKMQHPWSREAFIAADQYDLSLSLAWAENGRKGARPKRYPRPTDKPLPRFGKTGGRSHAEVLAILASRGHGPNGAAPKPVRRRDARGRFVRSP